MGIEAPIHVSMKLGDSSNVYNKIVSAAEHPHLSIPETEIGKKRKHYNRLVQNSLIFASGVSFNFSYQDMMHTYITNLQNTHFSVVQVLIVNWQKKIDC